LLIQSRIPIFLPLFCKPKYYFDHKLLYTLHFRRTKIYFENPKRFFWNLATCCGKGGGVNDGAEVAGYAEFRPEGPDVLPAPGNAWGYGAITFRLGPTGQPFSFMRENGRPVGPLKTCGGYDPQGDALVWENGWAFGPKLLCDDPFGECELIANSKKSEKYENGGTKNLFVVPPSAADFRKRR
jgi:hypothetical protein